MHAMYGSVDVCLRDVNGWDIWDCVAFGLWVRRYDLALCTAESLVLILYLPLCFGIWLLLMHLSQTALVDDGDDGTGC